jgi:hypothetical protein
LDPAGYGAGDNNLYRYVDNRPITGRDPSGLDDIPQWYQDALDEGRAIRDTTQKPKDVTRGDIEGDYTVDASVTARPDKEPKKGNPAVFKLEYVGTYFHFVDAKKGQKCCGGKGVRIWGSFKWYDTSTASKGNQLPEVTLGEWRKDIWNPEKYITNDINFDDYPGVLSVKKGTVDLRRSYVVMILCRSAKDPKRILKTPISTIQYMLDIYLYGEHAINQTEIDVSYGEGAEGVVAKLAEIVPDVTWVDDGNKL